MQIDKNILTFLAGEAAAQSTMGGGVSDAQVKMETEQDGLKIEIFTPTLGIEDYNIEIKNQFLQVYTLYVG